MKVISRKFVEKRQESNTNETHLNKIVIFNQSIFMNLQKCFIIPEVVIDLF